MFKACVNSKEQGNIAIGAEIAYFCSERYTVSIPLNDAQDYDLVVDINNILHKVQVKSVKYVGKSGFYMVSLKSSGGTSGIVYARVKDSDCSLLFVLADSGEKWLIPPSKFGDLKSQLTLNSSCDIYKIK